MREHGACAVGGIAHEARGETDMSGIVMLASDGVEYGESTVTLAVAVASFTVVGLMWMATTFGRSGTGPRHRMDAESDAADDDQ